MNIGSVVLSTPQGLGYLALDFHRHRLVTHPVVVRHTSRPNYSQEWYGTGTIQTSHLRGAVQRMLSQIDMMLFFETPFDWEILHDCRQAGVPTVLMTMYECTPEVLPQTPDYFLCPSLLDLDYFQSKPSQYLPVPVPDHIHWKLRTEARVFIHNAGNGGLLGRNGTQELLEACSLLRSPAEVRIYSQVPLGCPNWGRDLPPNVTVTVGQRDVSELYDQGDVFVFPEKFNGLSLPLQEAYASGMVVMATDRYPTNSWLPVEPLIPTCGSKKLRVGGRFVSISAAAIDPAAIAEKIDSWYGRDITELSQSGQQYKQAMSWHALEERYLQLFSYWKAIYS